MAFISKTDLKTAMDISNESSDSMLDVLAASVLSIWDMMTNRTWASTSYSEIIDGAGTVFFLLSNLPITAISRIVMDRTPAMTITNTNEQSTAFVEVLPTGLSLVLDGGEADKTVLFATYDTINKVVDAVNVIGSGWVAQVVAGRGDFKSSELVSMFPFSCIDSESVNLEIPATYLNNYRVDKQTGIVNYPAGVADSFQNIVVNYTAGYTDENVPEWLTRILIRQACFWFTQDEDKGWGVSSKGFGPDGGSTSFSKLENNLLPEFVFMAGMNRLVKP